MLGRAAPILDERVKTQRGGLAQVTAAQTSIDSWLKKQSVKECPLH